MMTLDEVFTVIQDTSHEITDAYYEKMEMSDISLLTMYIYLLKAKLEEYNSEENDVNE